MKSRGANIDLSTTHAVSRIFNVHSHSSKTTMVRLWLISPICVVCQLSHMKQFFCRVKIPDFSAARSSFWRSWARESCRIDRKFWMRWGFCPKRLSRVFAFCFTCCSRWRVQCNPGRPCNPRRVWQRQRHQSIILRPKFAARKPRSPSWGRCANLSCRWHRTFSKATKDWACVPTEDGGVEHPWQKVFDMMKAILPKSGVKHGLFPCMRFSGTSNSFCQTCVLVPSELVRA